MHTHFSTSLPSFGLSFCSNYTVEDASRLPTWKHHVRVTRGLFGERDFRTPSLHVTLSLTQQERESSLGKIIDVLTGGQFQGNLSSNKTDNEFRSLTGCSAFAMAMSLDATWMKFGYRHSPTRRIQIIRSRRIAFPSLQRRTRMMLCEREYGDGRQRRTLEDAVSTLLRYRHFTRQTRVPGSSAAGPPSFYSRELLQRP